jgi:hypothetical protein
VVVTPHAFKLTLPQAEPPRELTPPLAALWWAKKGDWGKAHRLVMEAGGPEAAWVHAYLHRVEGDLGNAGYWYRQARKPAASGDLDNEWTAMVETLLHAGAKRTT